VPVLHVGRISLDQQSLKLLIQKINASKTPIGQLDNIFKRFLYPLLPEMFEASYRLCSDHDVIVGHYINFPAQVAAEKAAKPYITVMLNHIGVPSKHIAFYYASDLGKWINPLGWSLYQVLVDKVFGPEINKLRTKVNLPPVKKIANTIWTSHQLNLIAVSAAFCRQQADWPAYQQVCGFFRLPDKLEKWTMPDSLKQFLDAGQPPVYMTLGSMILFDTEGEKLINILMEAALLAGCRAIVQCQWKDFPGIPDNPHIFKIQNAPHEYLFPYCSAVVHHGGAGTTHTATLHGCPSIIIEHFADQAFFAHELKRMGIAPAALHRKSLSSTKLAKAIRTVLDMPQMKKRAEELGAFMKKENGVKKAVELIESRFLHNRIS
jgi:sterol 3beta-glucosyltransferase